MLFIVCRQLCFVQPPAHCSPVLTPWSRFVLQPSPPPPTRVSLLQSARFVIQESTARTHALEAHAGFMAAEPPGDLHRRNVLSPGATHVGIGLCLTDKQFRLVEVFASRHVQVLSTAPTGEPAPGFELTSDDTHLFAKVRTIVVVSPAPLPHPLPVTARAGALYPQLVVICSWRRTCPHR
jgi:hypothetical protein